MNDFIVLVLENKVAVDVVSCDSLQNVKEFIFDYLALPSGYSVDDINLGNARVGYWFEDEDNELYFRIFESNLGANYTI